MENFESKNETFAYLVGKDIAALQAAISGLDNGGDGFNVLEVTIPATPNGIDGSIDALVEIPDAFAGCTCLWIEGNSMQLTNTSNQIIAGSIQSDRVLYLVKLYKKEEVKQSQKVVGALDNEQIERAKAQKAEKEKKAKDELIYKYLAKLLTTKYLTSVREKTKNSSMEAMGIKAYVNKNGLAELLEKPFEKNTSGSYGIINESIYANAKSEMLAVKAEIDKGEIDPSSAKDFNVESYNYEGYDEL